MPHLLVVDDSVGTRETYSAALRFEGHTVDLADCGAAAISYLSSAGRPDAILLDYQLGDMTGCDVLRWMQREGKMSPTAVLTAFPGSFDPDEAIGLGALAYSEQPLEIEVLGLLARGLTSPMTSNDPEKLHLRAIVGDVGALERLAAVFVEQIPPRLRRAFPKVPQDVAVDATVDATLEYWSAPRRFDPSRGVPLMHFVYMMAKRNLQDSLEAEASRKARERRWIEERMRRQSDEREKRHRLDVWTALREVASSSAEQRAVACWMRDGDALAIARALGCGDFSAEQQREQAYSFKARVLNRLSRRLRPH